MHAHAVLETRDEVDLAVDGRRLPHLRDPSVGVRLEFTLMEVLQVRF